jgi:putative transposase
MPEQITRRNLPHWYVPNAAVFITFRIAGTLPKPALKRLKQKQEDLLSTTPTGLSVSAHRRNVHQQIFLDYDQLLDNSRTLRWLSTPSIAAVVRSTLWQHHESLYRLLSYSIMPNHVHVLLRPFETALADVDISLDEPIGEASLNHSPLAKLMHSIKSYSAHEINRKLKRAGQLWQHESYDHWIRDDEDMERVVDYIDANAPTSRLSNKPHEYYWCSAHDRFLRDGELTGWLGEEGQLT